MADHISDRQRNNNQSTSDGVQDIAELLRQNVEKQQWRTTSKKVTSKLDLTGIAEVNFNELDLDGKGGISREELDKSMTLLSSRGEKDEARVAKTLRDNFSGLSADDKELKMSDFATFRFKHDEIKKEETILNDVQKGGADSSFKKVGGQLDSTLNYSQLEQALTSDNLTAKDRDVLGYMLFNYNQVEEMAKKNHPDQQGVTLADYKMFATQRLSNLPDAGQMDADMTKTTLVHRKIRVQSQPMKNSIEGPSGGTFEPIPQPNEKPGVLPGGVHPRPLKAVGSIQ